VKSGDSEERFKDHVKSVLGRPTFTRSQSAPVSDSQLQFQIESGARGMAFVFEWL
jgi:hypothetical protein